MNISNCSDIHVNITGQVMHLILDRPKSLNAHSLEMLREIERLILLADVKPSIRRIVISSSRRGIFCAGGDIKEVAAYSRDKRYDLVEQYFQTNKRVLLAMRATPVEIVCLVDGICFGGGFGLNMASDVRIATRTSSFAMPEARIGFYPDVGASYYLAKMPRAVGHAVGAEAKVLCAEISEQLNVVDCLIRDENYDIVAAALCEGAQLYDLDMESDFHISEVVDTLRSSGSGPLCPTSIAVAGYLAEWAACRTIQDCLEYEAQVSFQMAVRSDFVEGVAGVLGKNPPQSWAPDYPDAAELARILDCSKEEIESSCAFRIC